MAFGRPVRVPFTPRASTTPTSSWWIAENREAFQSAYRDQQARVIANANNTPVPTAKEHGSSRQEAGLRKVNHVLATVGLDPVSDE